MKVRKDGESCSNCEYGITSEMRDDIAKENHEYSGMNDKELEEAIGMCEFEFGNEIQKNNIFWCKEYSSIDTEVKVLVKTIEEL